MSTPPEPPHSTPTGRTPPATRQGSSPLDEAIFKFWGDFVGRQTRAGRRDVARMLEVALEFFFERSAALNQGDVRKRQHLQLYLNAVREERSKSDVLAQELAETWGEAQAPLPKNFTPVEVILREPNDPAAETEPLLFRPAPRPLTQRGELLAHRNGLAQQIGAAEAVIANITERLVGTRRLVAARLKELSPLLYQQGIDLVAEVEARDPSPPPPPEAPATTAIIAPAAARSQAWSIWWSNLWRSLQRLTPGKVFRRLRGTLSIREIREKHFEENLKDFLEKSNRWDRR